MQYAPLNIVEFYWVAWFIFSFVVASVFGAVILEPFFMKKFGTMPINTREGWGYP